MLKLTNVRLAVGRDERELPSEAARRLRLPAEGVRNLRILRKSLDVRNKAKIEHVYTLAVEVENEAKALRSRPSEVAAYAPTPFDAPKPGFAPLRTRPLVVGAGPGGLLAAYVLAEYGYQPILLERGRPVSQRTRDVAAFDAGADLDPESNYLFGEGGAGAFSDGKLTCRNTGPDTDRVLEILAQCKGKPSIVYEAKPHLGSNRLPAVVKALRSAILAMGGEIRFQCRVDDFDIADGKMRGVWTSQGYLAAEIVLLAPGHSARDTYLALHRRGVALSARPFQMGVRIEQPQANVTLAQHGSPALVAILGPADYTLKVHAGANDLFTFCMCAGGYIMPSVSQAEHFCTNGMSRSKHESPLANSGLVITVDPQRLPSRGMARRDPLLGLRHQAAIERSAFHQTGGGYLAPVQRAGDFLAGRQSIGPIQTTYARGVRSHNLWDFLPADVTQALMEGLPLMDRQWNGLFLRDAILTGPEARGSSPVRIDRDPASRCSTNVIGLYPVGEGAGFAGGIVSAAVDGLRSARVVINQFQPAEK